MVYPTFRSLTCSIRRFSHSRVLAAGAPTRAGAPGLRYRGGAGLTHERVYEKGTTLRAFSVEDNADLALARHALTATLQAPRHLIHSALG